MLKKEDIKNGNLVFNADKNTYHIIDEVGNARSKGNRGNSSTPKDELSYTTIDIVSGEKFEGICECSGITNETLSIATVKDVDIYLAILEADNSIKLGKVKKESAIIQNAINNFEKYKSEQLKNIKS
jgi:hypothetical protein